MNWKIVKKTGAVLTIIMFAPALLALTACGPAQSLTYKQVQDVVGLSEDDVRARLGSPHYLTDAGESVWWNYDDVVGASGVSVSCHVIFKMDRVDQVNC